MDIEYKNEKFETFKVKASVAKKFKWYCRRISKSHSMTLLLMLEFFEENGISPQESIGPHIQTLESLFKKRINGLISIIKDIEKTQTKPTLAMLQALLEPPPKKPLMVEKKRLKEMNDSLFDRF